MRTAAERVTEVGGQRAHVGARRALDVELDRRPARSSTGSTSKRWTVTGRGSRSTSMPSRASSWSRLPPTWTADTIGGTCRMSPVSGTRRRAARASAVTRRHVVGRGRPRRARRASSSRRRARSRRCRSCGSTVRKRSRRVTRPTPSSSTPVASGSSVPEWPIFRLRSSPRALATTSWDVQPASLSTTATPSRSCSSGSEHALRARRVWMSRRISSMRSPRRTAGSGRNASSGVRFTRAWPPMARCSRTRISPSASEAVVVGLAAFERVEVDGGVPKVRLDLDRGDRRPARGARRRLPRAPRPRISRTSWLTRAVRGIVPRARLVRVAPSVDLQPVASNVDHLDPGNDHTNRSTSSITSVAWLVEPDTHANPSSARCHVS